MVGAVDAVCAVCGMRYAVCGTRYSRIFFSKCFFVGKIFFCWLKSLMGIKNFYWLSRERVARADERDSCVISWRGCCVVSCRWWHGKCVLTFVFYLIDWL